MANSRHVSNWSDQQRREELDNDIRVSQEAAQIHADAGAYGTAAMMRGRVDRLLDERNELNR